MHVLSFDVEEYFQVEAAARGGVRPEQWHDHEMRLAPCVDRILDLLAEHSVTATFFVLGWVARHQQDVVERIARAGHEIASHGLNHRMLTMLTGEPNREELFRDELLDSRKRLEDISGRQVVGYRAPTFSITHTTAWALDVLAEAGFAYDSSIFPVRHDRYGVCDAPRWAHRAVGPGGGQILEIPPLTLRMIGVNLPVGGGGYLRLLPSPVVARGLRVAEKLDHPGMIYLHPWEIDAGQPVLPMGRLSRWRHRVNLHKTEAKLRRLLRTFRFGAGTDLLKQSPDLGRDTFRYGRDGGGA